MDANELCNHGDTKAQQEARPQPERRPRKGRVTVVDRKAQKGIQMVPGDRADTVRSASLPRCPACDVCATHLISNQVVESILEQAVQLNKDSGFRHGEVLRRLADLERLLLEGDSSDEGSDGELPDSD